MLFRVTTGSGGAQATDGRRAVFPEPFRLDQRLTHGVAVISDPRCRTVNDGTACGKPGEKLPGHRGNRFGSTRDDRVDRMSFHGLEAHMKRRRRGAPAGGPGGPLWKTLWTTRGRWVDAVCGARTPGRCRDRRPSGLPGASTGRPQTCPRRCLPAGPTFKRPDADLHRLHRPCHERLGFLLDGSSPCLHEARTLPAWSFRRAGRPVKKPARLFFPWQPGPFSRRSTR